MRRLWLVALCLYALAATADFAVHLNDDRRAGGFWLSPAHLAVAVSASLFWPADLLTQLLLAH